VTELEELVQISPLVFQGLEGFPQLRRVLLDDRRERRLVELRPITAAVCSTSFSRAARRSMRAAKRARTELGTSSLSPA